MECFRKHVQYWTSPHYHTVCRPVRRGSSLDSFEPLLQYLWQTKSEPNHFVAVQDLIEGSELEASLKLLEVPSYALYAPHCPPFCYDVIG